MRNASVAVALALLAGCASSASEEAATGSDAVTAATTQIVASAASKDADGKVHVGVRLGFADSSFDGDTKAFCYVGAAAGVCAQVKAYEAAMNAQYTSGAHDTIAVAGCTSETKDGATTVTVRYNLADDYGGDVDVTKTIGACWSYEPAPAPRTKVYAGGASASADGTVSTRPTLGFHDSTFDSDTKAFCYVGSAADLCGIVASYAAEMNAQYTSGAHDTMDLGSCTVAGDTATASYHLSDDYGGDQDVTASIAPCR